MAQGAKKATKEQATGDQQETNRRQTGDQQETNRRPTGDQQETSVKAKRLIPFSAQLHQDLYLCMASGLMIQQHGGQVWSVHLSRYPGHICKT